MNASNWKLTRLVAGVSLGLALAGCGSSDSETVAGEDAGEADDDEGRDDDDATDDDASEDDDASDDDTEPDAGGDDDTSDDDVSAEDAGSDDDASDDDTDGDAGDDDAADDDLSDDDADAGMEPDDAGAPRENVGNIQGRIERVDGTAVTDVVVVAGNVATRTDNRGIFTLEDVPEGEVDLYVRSSDYSEGHAKVALSARETVSTRLKVMPLQLVVLTDAEAGGTVQGGDGVAVTLPGGALRDKDGNAVTGAVDVKYALVNDVDALAAAPGGMMALGNGRESERLESFGMVDIDIRKDGEELTLDGVAEIRFPLAPQNPFAEGESLPLYGFDQAVGAWVMEGQAAVQGGAVVAQVGRSSWWNCAQPLANKSCFVGEVQTETGTPVARMGLSVTGVDYLTNSSATTDADGAFCVDVKLASTNRLTAFGGGSGAFFGLDLTAQAGTEATTCGLGGCVDLGVVTADRLLTDCKEKTVEQTDHIYVMSSGNAALDEAAQASLEGLGQTVTVGVPYTAFENVDLDAYDAVYLQANSNWSSGDMPLAGQVQLVDWVNCGGGLVASEWVLWKTASGNYAVLDHTFPAVPTTSFTSSAVDIVYSEVDSDPIMNAGLPAEFTFVADSFAGTETDMTPRPGSVVFYDSVNLGSGVVGWAYNHGRVVNISTVAGSGQLADANYSRLFSNSFDWARGIERAGTRQ